MQSVLVPLLIVLLAAPLHEPGSGPSSTQRPLRAWRRPAITPRSALPIARGGVAHVEPTADCPPALGTDAVSLGVRIADPPLLDYSQPGMPAPADLVGMVIVEVRIDADGKISRAKTLRGDARLGEPVIAATRKWRYARTCLGGTPIPVIKTIALSLVAAKRGLPPVARS